MTRTNAREIAMHYLFSLGFSTQDPSIQLNFALTKEAYASLATECHLYRQFPNKKQADYIRHLVEGASAHGPELDDYISRYAKGWSFTRIPQVVTALLRVAMFEILYISEIPNSVAINDALEIAKHYEDPEMISFMNGILGSFVREEFDNTPTKPSTMLEELFDNIDSLSNLDCDEEDTEEEILSVTKE